VDYKSVEMEEKQFRIPPGPQDAYPHSDDLLEWMGRQFEAFGDIYKASVYGAEAYAIRDADFAYHVLVENWQNYVKGQMIRRVALLLGNGLMVSEGEFWKRQRRMIQAAFNAEPMRYVTELSIGVNSRLLEKWQVAARKGKPVNVTRDVSAMAMEVVLRFIFGEDYERLGGHFGLLSEEKARNIEFARSFRALGKVILEAMARRRKEKVSSRDAVGMFMEARDPQNQQGMQDDQIVDEVLTLIVAGHETTASTLNWAWYLLSQHAALQEKLWGELIGTSFCGFEDLPKFPYARQILEEVMRLYPAGWLVTRKALKEDALGEYFVPAGTEIFIPLYFIQRHPKLWEDPDHFEPERFRSENVIKRHRLASIPFSAGPRNCIGAQFARIEMQVHLMMMAKCLCLKYTQDRPIELEAGVNLRSKQDFVMYPELRTMGESQGG
jgi:cytochrome P450